jgi:sn-glycerol 3-phosphate transport system permease protein
MSALDRKSPFWQTIETAAAWVLGLLWLAPLLYAIWTAFHPAAYSTRFDLTAPLTLENFARAWDAAPFSRYFFNTIVIVTIIVVSQ